MKGESILSLTRYDVEKICFILNDGFEFNDEPIKLNPTFDRGIKKINKDSAKIILGFEIKSTEENPSPFNLSIVISGIFELNDWESKDTDIMKYNTLSVLFPFLRSLIATVTANASIPPYILPVININALFDEDE